MIDSRIRHGVLLVVVVVWATNFFAGLFIGEYQPDPQVHAVFMIVVGAIFAVDLKPSKRASPPPPPPKENSGGGGGG